VLTSTPGLFEKQSMAKYNLWSKGSVNDALASLKYVSEKATVDELQTEIDLEMKHKCRVSLINRLNQVISKKLKGKK
jgi:hypothetical protein